MFGDQVAPERKAREIADGVRNGRAVRVADAAHLPPAEQPDVVAQLLLDFFEASPLDTFLHDQETR